MCVVSREEYESLVEYVKNEAVHTYEYSLGIEIEVDGQDVEIFNFPAEVCGEDENGESILQEELCWWPKIESAFNEQTKFAACDARENFYTP